MQASILFPFSTWKLRECIVFHTIKEEGLSRDIKKHGIDVDLVLLKAEKRTADEVVLDYAKKLKPDLLLIMTHQETILFDNYLGAFAREIVHKSRRSGHQCCPPEGQPYP